MWRQWVTPVWGGSRWRKRIAEGNIRHLVKAWWTREMDGVAQEQRKSLAIVDSQLAKLRRRLDWLYNLVDTTDLETAGRHFRHQRAPGAREAAGRVRGRDKGPDLKTPLLEVSDRHIRNDSEVV